MIQTRAEALRHACDLADCQCAALGNGCAGTGGCPRDVATAIRVQILTGPASRARDIAEMYAALRCGCGATGTCALPSSSQGCRHQTLDLARSLADRWEREDQAAGQRATVSLAYFDGNASSSPSRVRMCGMRNALDVARGRGE
jgi:hypothetical protein